MIKEKKSKFQLKKAMRRKFGLPIWKKAFKGQPAKSFKETENVIGVYVNPESGKLATKACPASRLTYYVKGTEPVEYCAEHFKGKNSKRPPKEEEQKDSMVQKSIKAMGITKNPEAGSGFGVFLS